MGRNIENLNKLNFSNSNHSIVYAPNSTGKTRLTNKLSNQYKNEASMFLTSKEISNMLAFSGRQIFVGTDSTYKLENEQIAKDVNLSKYGDEILRMYQTKNASTLSKESCLFSLAGLKRKDTFDIYVKLISFVGNRKEKSNDFSVDEMIKIDRLLSRIELEPIQEIIKKAFLITLTVKENLFL